nr:LysR family transcriptional regulator [Pseudoxanthomonas sp.]
MNTRLPPLNALRAFEATARLGGVSQAARELHVTHGAVSRQIRLLEADLGLALFSREGRGLRLTPAGRQLQEATGTAFARLQDATTRLRSDTPSALVLGCPGSLLARWMIPRLERLGRDLSGLTLHLAAQEGGFDPELAGLDAAFLLAEAPWPAGWQVRELAPERIGPVVSPRHPAAGQPARLLDEPLLHTTSRPQAWPSWAARHGVDPARLRYGNGFEHLYYLLEAALAGIGVAIAPEPLVTADLDAGRLLAPWGFSATGGAWILARRRGTADPRVDRLGDWLERELAIAAANPATGSGVDEAPG